MKRNPTPFFIQHFTLSGFDEYGTYFFLLILDKSNDN
jgi:hypothetical protein